MNEREKMYFITVFEHLKMTELGWPDMGDVRCWGFYKDFKHANEIVTNNITDLNETIYDYCVIEEIEEGISAYAKQRWFFKFDYENRVYVDIPEPDELKTTCNIAIG